MFKTFIMSILLSERFWGYLIDGIVAIFKDNTKKDDAIDKFIEKVDNEDLKEIFIKSAKYLSKESDNGIDDMIVKTIEARI